MTADDTPASHREDGYKPRPASELWPQSPMNPENKKKKRERKEMEFIEDVMR